MRARAAALAVIGLLGGCEGCLQRVPTETVEKLPYPGCSDGSDAGPGELLHSGELRSGPGMSEQVVERYEYRKRGCLIVFTARQDWRLGVSDVEVVFDRELRPLRAWKRMTLPGAEQVLDVRLYELRKEPATLTWRGEEGLRHFWFRGGRPGAVVGPGRGLVSAWIKAHAGLGVGESVRERVLDFRGLVERVQPVTLRRDRDRAVPKLGTVRVYTIFGRESVYTDEDGWVVGDLAGMRPEAVLEGPPPEPLPTPGPPDPRAPP